MYFMCSYVRNERVFGIKKFYFKCSFRNAIRLKRRPSRPPTVIFSLFSRGTFRKKRFIEYAAVYTPSRELVRSRAVEFGRIH